MNVRRLEELLMKLGFVPGSRGCSDADQIDEVGERWKVFCHQNASDSRVAVSTGPSRHVRITVGSSTSEFDRGIHESEILMALNNLADAGSVMLA